MMREKTNQKTLTCFLSWRRLQLQTSVQCVLNIKWTRRQNESERKRREEYESIGSPSSQSCQHQETSLFSVVLWDGELINSTSSLPPPSTETPSTHSPCKCVCHYDSMSQLRQTARNLGTGDSCLRTPDWPPTHTHTTQPPVPNTDSDERKGQRKSTETTELVVTAEQTPEQKHGNNECVKRQKQNELTRACCCSKDDTSLW